MLKLKKILKENPDKIKLPNGNIMSWMSWDAYPFARSLKTGKFQVGPPRGNHGILFYNERPDGVTERTRYMTDIGRVFFLEIKKEISVWVAVVAVWPDKDEYYPSEKEFKEIIKELRPLFDKYNVEDRIYAELPENQKIVPVGYYKTSKARPDELKAYQLHLAKNKGEILRNLGAKGIGSDKKIPGMSSKETPAEFKHKYAPVGENFLLPPEEHSHSGIVKFDEEEKQMKKKKEEFLQEAVIIGQMAEDYMEESEASEKAKEMGLVHKGFGKYGKSKDKPATHKTENGKLIPFAGSDTEGKKKRGVEFTGKTEKEKEEEKRHKEKPKMGLTSIKRIRSEKGKAAFSFRYNGKYNEMVFTKGEYKLMVKKHIAPSRIILARIEKAKEEKIAAQKGAAEKKAERKKEYARKKKELGPQEPQQKKIE